MQKISDIPYKEYFRTRADAPNDGASSSNGAESAAKMQRAIGREEIAEAIAKLKEYAAAKEPLDQRIVEEEQWYRLRHWEYLRREVEKKKCEGKKKTPKPEPTSAWLFNAMNNRHADMMDNYPIPALLPRERADEADSKVLSSIVPVVMERNRFRVTYDDTIWYLLMHGMVGYSVTWDSALENGLGDVGVSGLDILGVYWEPGITDIQQSAHLFICDLVDTDKLKAEYPDLPERVFGAQPIRMARYADDEHRVDLEEHKKTLVIDWYTKKIVNGLEVLCYTKFIGEDEEGILYSSLDDPSCPNGWYEDRRYPVVIARLYPVSGSIAGFGMIALGKDPQMYIDRMDQNFMINMDQASRNRWWGKKELGIDKDQFRDLDEDIVEVAGNIDEEKLRQINVNGLDSIYYTMKQYKIEEMKETLSNRDVAQGGTSGGVTAASAIAALQEAGNKVSRDMIARYYAAYEQIIEMVIERIRQFYTEAREFRITGENGYGFVSYSNAGIAARPIKQLPNGDQLYRKPIFDIKVKAQRRNPFSQLSQNENAKELFGMGVFNPEAAQMVLPMLEMMEFEGIEKVKEQVQQGATLLNQLQQAQQQIVQLTAIVAQLSGVGMGAPAAVPSGEGVSPPSDVSIDRSALGRAHDSAAQKAQQNYAQTIAARA